MNQTMPLRQARIALGLTTAEAGQYVHVTRKTWEAWEAKEEAGQPVPAAALELFFAKLEAQQKRIAEGPGRDDNRELVVVFRRDPVTSADVPADVVSSDNYLGDIEDSLGFRVIKSLAVDRSGRPYVHRTRYVAAHNKHVLAFCRRHTSVAD